VTKLRTNIIVPTDAPFNVSGFWKDDTVTVFTFTRIDKREMESITDQCVLTFERV